MFIDCPVSYLCVSLCWKLLLSTVGTLYIMFACRPDDETCFAELDGENTLAQAEVESQVV